MSTCEQCVYAGPRRNFQDHDCRRRAPVAQMVDFSVDIRGCVPRFPIVKADDWCGEFAARNVEAPARQEDGGSIGDRVRSEYADTYDLAEDVISRIRFERMTKAEQHAELRRVVYAEGLRWAELWRAVLQTSVGRQVLASLASGDGVNTEDGRAWIKARDALSDFLCSTPPKRSTFNDTREE